MHRTALVLSIFAVVFSTLAIFSYRQKSATWDEPQHVVRGCLGWRGDQRMDPEHPPFLRLWAALPVAFDKSVKLDTTVINSISPADWVGFQQFLYTQHYVYQVNDADRLLYRERFMIVLLGLLLGGLLFYWANECFGSWPAVVVLALYCCEPNLAAHASLVTTDFGATCFMFGTLYFLWRASRQFNALNAGGAIVFFTLAMVSKFTTLMLLPVFVILLFRKGEWRRATGILAGMLVAAWLAMWAVYGFRYAPSANPDWLFRFQEGSPFGSRFPIFARLAVWADEHKLLPNACSQGFLLGQIKAQARSAYLFGHFSNTGWWYYFPVAWLIKTPVALLVLFATGAVFAVAQWRRWDQLVLYLLLPVVFLVGLSMTQKLNIGLRHILPVYPLMLMAGGIAVEWLLRRGQRKLVVAGLVLMTGEFFVAYPSPLAFFNVFVGGPTNGDACLVDSNFDWGQDLKGVKRWMDDSGVKHINLCYFGTAEPSYYGMDCTFLPGNGITSKGSLPQLPGYIAISATNLRGAYFPEQLRQFYSPLLTMKPEAKIGYSIYVYKVERPWWQ